MACDRSPGEGEVACDRSPGEGEGRGWRPLTRGCHEVTGD